MQRGVLPLLGLSLAAVCATQPLSAADGLQYPLGAVLKKDGTLVILDRKLPGLWQAKDGQLTVLYQASLKNRTPLNAPRCIALDEDDNVLVGDTSTREVYRIDADGKPVPLTNGAIGKPMSIAVAADGAIFVADAELHRIVTVPSAGGAPKIFANARAVRGLAFASDGSLVAVTGIEDRQLLRFESDGTPTPLLNGRPFRFPNNVTARPDGLLFVTDAYGKCVWKIEPDKAPVKLAAGEPFVNPVGIARAGEELLITDPRVPAVFRGNLDGTVSKIELKSSE